MCLRFFFLLSPPPFFFADYPHIYIFTCWALLLVLVCLVYRLTKNMNWNYSTLTWLTRSVELLHKNPYYRLGTHMMRWIHTHAVKPPQCFTQPILALKMIRRYFFFLLQAILNRFWHFLHWVWNMFAILVSFFFRFKKNKSPFCFYYFSPVK